ncbi:hypothetical protein F4677DRAFT_441861 [Hypoxylon crocopeplum]|nr:hypothetical protein F4677DRAFT_441861 [Hypoxylon crocopeplum]
MSERKVTPPPPYSEADAAAGVEYSATTKGYSIPQTVSVFWPKQLDRVFYVGETWDELLFTVKMGYEKPSRTPLEVRLSSKPKGSVIARVDELSDGVIVIPPPMGSPAEHNGTRVVLQKYTEWNKPRHMFSMVVGPRPWRKTETFEWRRSSGGKVRQLDGCTTGWKLVRVHNEVSPIRDDPARRAQQQEDLTSDNKEVVAVFSVNESWFPSGKALMFRLHGSGATGELGGDFALVALLSAFKVWNPEESMLNYIVKHIP